MTKTIVSERITLAQGHMDRAYNVVLIQAGRANGLAFPAEVLAWNVDAFNGVPCFIDHGPRAGQALVANRSVRDLVGLISDARWDPVAQAVRARLSVSNHAKWVHEMIAEFGPSPGVFGLSADLWVLREGRRVRQVHQVNSVDIVVNPAAGGRFEPAAPTTPEEVIVNESNPSQVNLSQEPASTLPPLRMVPSGAMGEGTTVALARTTQQAGATVAVAEPSAVADPESDDLAMPGGTGSRELARQLLELKLSQSRLPEALKDHCRMALSQGRVDLDGATDLLQRSQDAWARANAQAAISHLGSRLRVRDGIDQLELAFSRLMGIKLSGDQQSVPALTGIREMYDALTGDWERQGVFRPERVSLANATTSTMAQVTANVLNKAVLAAYTRRPQWWKPIVHEEDFSRMQDVRWITLGGFGDLDTVSEGAAYTEKTWDDYAETASFVKKGNYLGVTLEMIDRDDVGALRAIPRQIAAAANRTLASAVSAIFTASSGVGPTLADTEALFDAAHANLGTSALSAASWDAAVQAMFQQAEYHSDKAIGVRPRWCLVPIELEKTALGIFTSEYEWGGSGMDSNVRRSDARHVIAVPDWTDTNNWAAVADPADLEGVCVGYRFGRAPEIFVADNGLTGSMFTNDELRVKCRFVYCVGVGDYRALYKANVTD